MNNEKITAQKNSKSPRPQVTVDWGMLDELVGFHLRRAQSVVFENFMKLAKEERVTPGQFGVLTLIKENPGLNQSGLANALGIERSTMVAVINVLEDRGLVRRQESKADRRSYVLSLTKPGKEFLKAANEKVRQNEAMIAAVLDGSERKMLVKMLKKISGHSG